MSRRRGKYFLRVTFQRNTPTKGNAGQEVDSWSDLGKAFASIRPVRGREYLTQSGENSDVTHSIGCRAQDSFTLRPDDRVLYGSRVFDIKSALDVDERGRDLELMCVERISV